MSEGLMNDEVMDTVTTLHTCPACEKRPSDPGSICEYCYKKIQTLESINVSKRGQIDAAPPEAQKKMRKNIEKRERKIERMKNAIEA